jgi:L-fuconolactonase
MSIDSHQHFWQYDPRRDTWITDEMAVLKRDFLPCDLLPELAANGIVGSVAVQASQAEEETRFLLDLARQCPAIAGVVGWTDLRASNLPERLAHYSQFRKLRGFRHIVQSEPDDYFLLRDDFSRGVGRLRQFNFTYDILIYAKQLPAAIELAGRFPEQRFVLDHIAKPSIRTREITQWSKHIREIAGNPNVYCKLSGLITQADSRTRRPDDFKPFLDVVFEAFGPDRLMFGSDWPVCLVVGTYRQVKELIADYTGNLARAEREKIFGLNAIRFYSLEASQNGLATQG